MRITSLKQESKIFIIFGKKLKKLLYFVYSNERELLKVITNFVYFISSYDLKGSVKLLREKRFSLRFHFTSPPIKYS